LSCGSSSSENCTYLTLTSTTSTTDCSYQICPASTSVNRIRLDFSTFQIASPFEPAAAGLDGTGLASAATQTASVGHCTTDTFTATGAPVICGLNTGQHMILDTDGSKCVDLAFSYGKSTATRQYNIHVTQYDALNEMGGPAGCLQYFTSDTGTVSTFNWEAPTATDLGIHLANQDYSVCVRRNADKCAICWDAVINTAGVTYSFGLSVSSADAKQDGVVGAGCTTDFVDIPGAYSSHASITTVWVSTMLTTLLTNPLAATTASYGKVDRQCGRIFGGIQAQTAPTTVCSRTTPFRLGVVTDGTEVLSADTTNAKEGTNELSANTGSAGTQGFSLGFALQSCI
jgi:hypothetical protein